MSAIRRATVTRASASCTEAGRASSRLRCARQRTTCRHEPLEHRAPPGLPQWPAVTQSPPPVAPQMSGQRPPPLGSALAPVRLPPPAPKETDLPDYGALIHILRPKTNQEGLRPSVAVAKGATACPVAWPVSPKAQSSGEPSTRRRSASPISGCMSAAFLAL